MTGKICIKCGLMSENLKAMEDFVKAGWLWGTIKYKNGGTETNATWPLSSWMTAKSMSGPRMKVRPGRLPGRSGKKESSNRNSVIRIGPDTGQTLWWRRIGRFGDDGE